MNAQVAPECPRSILLVLVGAVAFLSACGARQRNPTDPLVETPSREQFRTVASVQWPTLFHQGLALTQSGDLIRAEQYLTAAVRRGGPPEKILPLVLRICVGGQRYRAAVEYTRPYLDQHSDAWALRYVVAMIHLGLGEPLVARQHLDLVVEHNPAHAEAHFTLGKILREDLRDPVSADAHFRKYLELEPEGVHADEARAGRLERVRP